MLKFILLLSLLYSQFAFSEEFSYSVDSPRATMKTFLKSMVKVKEKKGVESDNYKVATSTLDLSSIESTLRQDIGQKYAQELIKTIDKIKYVKYENIPSQLNQNIWYFDKRMQGSKLLEISIVKIQDKWLFSKATLKSLNQYQLNLAKKKIADGVIELKTTSDKLKEKLPPFFSKKHLLLENWQWLGIFLMLSLAYLVEVLSYKSTTFILGKNIPFLAKVNNVYLKKAVKPFSKILFLSTIIMTMNSLELKPETYAAIKRIIYIFQSVFSVWLSHNIITLVSFSSLEMAKQTDSKFDDILVPLLTKTAYVIVYLLGGILIASSLTIDVSNLIAGLGIGGLAFAFAAKDTLANLFGSVMLVLDRPFDIGDIIVAGDIEGTVVEVGFRSTRIRTYHDSIITISNGELMNRSIDNKGKRRFRRLSSTLGLEYDTSPEKIEAFCEGIRELIRNHRWTRKDYFNVYFTNFGASSLDLQLMVFWETADYTREQAEKHRLMIDILRLARELEVGFAFPTQTVHLFNETKAISEEDVQEYLSMGRDKASGVLKKPLSLKNPRSNAQDEDQFGKNDIGL